jgi:hypothetical protein
MGGYRMKAVNFASTNKYAVILRSIHLEIEGYSRLFVGSRRGIPSTRRAASVGVVGGAWKAARERGLREGQGPHGFLLPGPPRRPLDGERGWGSFSLSGLSAFWRAQRDRFTYGSLESPRGIVDNHRREVKRGKMGGAFGRGGELSFMRKAVGRKRSCGHMLSRGWKIVDGQAGEA